MHKNKINNIIWLINSLAVDPSGHRNCFLPGPEKQNKSRSGDGKMAYQGSVLVVDDELGPRESLRRILSPPYEVFTAQDREEALQAICNKENDLVPLDLNRPNLSGMDVLEEIKRMGADVDVIIISG
jgi:PleD family two-component response regulator